MARNTYLVAYDISNAKRLQRMFRRLHGFGDPFQYSIFLCDLSAKERVGLVEAISEIMHAREDRVFIADLGPAEGRADGAVQLLGRMELPKPHRAVVV